MHEHEPQASESTRKFDNVMTWRQFAFYYNLTKVRKKKRISETHITFHKESTVEPARSIRTFRGHAMLL